MDMCPLNIEELLYLEDRGLSDIRINVARSNFGEDHMRWGADIFGWQGRFLQAHSYHFRDVHRA